VLFFLSVFAFFFVLFFIISSDELLGSGGLRTVVLTLKRLDSLPERDVRPVVNEVAIHWHRRAAL